MARDESVSLQRLISSIITRRFPSQVANIGDHVGMMISTLHDVERGAAAVVMLCVDLTEQDCVPSSHPRVREAQSSLFFCERGSRALNRNVAVAKALRALLDYEQQLTHKLC